MLTADGRNRGVQLLKRLASPRLTVLFFLATAIGALLVARAGANATLMMALPFALLVLNTLAALITKARFRSDLPLLVFHLALLLLVVLFVAARLVYFQGGVKLSLGTGFNGELTVESRGLLHPGKVEQLRFENAGYTADYLKRGYENITYNKLRWWQDGTARISVIGDDRPLILDGYRIYTTRTRGFSPLFQWQPYSGASEYGAVQLDDQGGEEFAPATEWQLPSGVKAWVMLELGPVTEALDRRRGNFKSQTLAHRLILRIGSDRYLLEPGQSLELPGGRLNYLRLDSWMAYRLVYEPLMPWMLATVAVGIVSLLWLYARLFFRSWRRASANDQQLGQVSVS